MTTLMSPAPDVGSLLRDWRQRPPPSGPALATMADGVADELLTPNANVLRLSLHPDGLAPRIANLAEWGGHLVERLDRQIAVTADPELIALADELQGYAGVTPPSPR